MTTLKLPRAWAANDPLPSVRNDVVLRREGDERFAVDLETGDIFDMNDTAAFVLDSCRAGGTFGGLVAAMLAQYGETHRDEIERDLAEVLDEFGELGLTGR